MVCLSYAQVVGVDLKLLVCLLAFGCVCCGL